MPSDLSLGIIQQGERASTDIDADGNCFGEISGERALIQRIYYAIIRAKGTDPFLRNEGYDIQAFAFSIEPISVIQKRLEVLVEQAIQSIVPVVKLSEILIEELEPSPRVLLARLSFSTLSNNELPEIGLALS